MPDDTRELARATNQDLATMPFQEALDAYTPNLASVLPSHIPLDRFKRVVLTAVNITPELASADRRSLFNACAKCAHDGLYPDGREAALVIYRTKVKRKVTENGKVVEREFYADLVTYMPMVAGIRKRMRNTGEVLSADAQTVCRNDKFHYEFGDDPKIIHEPPMLGQERGETIGAYAVIKLANGETLREVMGKPEIERVRTFSRNAAGARSPWTTSWDEMARKTVLRRCSKAAPTGSDLERMLARDDELPPLHSQARLHEIPPRPQRQDFLVSHSTEEDDGGSIGDATAPAFEIVDLDGQVHEHAFAASASAALIALMEEAKIRGKDAVEGVWESNSETVREISEAIEDGAEPLHQAYEDVIASFGTAGEKPPPSEGAATSVAADIPGEGTSSPPAERTEPKSANADLRHPNETSTNSTPPRGTSALHAARDEKFWSQEKYILPGKTPKEILYYADQFLRQCRDQIDINGIEMDSATKFEQLPPADKKQIEQMIAQRRRELPQ